MVVICDVKLLLLQVMFLLLFLKVNRSKFTFLHITENKIMMILFRNAKTLILRHTNKPKINYFYSTYIQGQEPEPKVREYFYYIDHQGMVTTEYIYRNMY